MSKKSWPRTVTVGHATVKVYRIAHHSASGWIYVVAWSTPTGRKREKFADPDDALREARLKASQLSQGRVEGATMSSGDRDELLAARRIAGAVPVLAALEEWTKARQLSGGNVIAACEAWAARNGKAHRRVKVAVVVEEFMKAKTAAGKNVAEDHASTFERIIADLGQHFIDTVSAKQLDAWLAQWENPVTRNTRRKRLVSVWRWAQRKGYLPRDARTEPEMTDVAHEPAPVIGIINVPTWRGLLTHFREHHPELLPALVLAGFCGLRRSEIHAQVWEDIELERKHLRVSAAKRGTPARRMVPICDAAVEWLMLAKHRKGYVCPTIEYKKKLQPSLAIDGIRRIARECTPPFVIPENAFRHSYISHAVAATGDIPRVSLNAGNSPKEINRHYRELVSESEGKAWFDSPPRAGAAVISLEPGKAASA
jgi:integrase